MKELKIGGLQIKVPVIQGGMGVGISLSGLAAAVANEGGLGVISSAGLGLIHNNSSLNYLEANNEGLRIEIRKARAKSNGIIGVNVMVAMTNYSELVSTAISENVDIIFAGAGLPLDLPSFIKENNPVRLVPIVSSGRAAKIICQKWDNAFSYIPDAIVVEGPKAGGHLGFKTSQIEDTKFSLEFLVSEVLNEVKFFEDKYGKEIPVIAAGGIYTGFDMFNIMQKGAKGVQMGTRFVTTKECDASDAFKNTYLKAQINDIVIIESPVGMPGRAINNSFLEKVKQGLKIPLKCPFHCIKTCDIVDSPYCIIAALINSYKGNMESGYAFAGANAYLADKITTVKEIFNELISDFKIASLNANMPI
ncbi:MAG: nitronate monooxygenase family protein [Bacteroidales bacterium]|nr:nitronate monooxygenase family protein [Bacteroidales bacterium]